MTIEEKITERLIKLPQLCAINKFSWERHSDLVCKYCPEFFNKENFNWERKSWAIPMYCPDKLDPNLYNWKQDSGALLFHHPNHKYIRHCVWSTKTIGFLKFYTEYHSPIWNKYKNQLNDLLDPRKREVLLNKIAKELALEKI